MAEYKREPLPGGANFKFMELCGIHCGKFVPKQHEIGHCYTCHSLKFDKAKLKEAFATHRTNRQHR